MEKIFESYELFVETLSPVHIGDGDDLMFTDYVIDPEKKKMSVIDLSLLMGLFNETEQNIFANGSILSIQQVLYKNLAHINKFKALESLSVTKEVIDRYLENLGEKARSDGRINNQTNSEFAIKRTIKNTAQRKSIISGSSIKGAIKTAVMEKIRLTRPNSRMLKNAGDIFDYQSKDTYKDPFANIKISDGTATGGVRHSVCLAKRYKLKERSDGAIPEYIEVIDPNQEFSLKFQIHTQQNYNSLRVTKDLIINACKEFYVPLLEKEMEKLYKLEYLSDEDYGLFKDILEEINSSKNKFLVRIGNHSGFEATTFGNYIRLKNKSADGLPTTITLCSFEYDDEVCLLPFGWALCSLKTIN